MPRPWRRRYVYINPEATHFRPQEFSNRKKECVNLELAELEALRLKDFAGLDQQAAAKKMKVPTTTFQRTLYSARKKVAEALIYGKAILINERKGVINMPGGDGTGPIGQGPVGGQGRGRGRGRQPGGFGLGLGGDCVCPACDTKVPHRRGTPCNQAECPKCGAKMVRANN